MAKITLDNLAQECLKLQGKRGGKRRASCMVNDPITRGPEARKPTPARSEHGGEQVGGCGLAVGPRYTREAK